MSSPAIFDAVLDVRSEEIEGKERLSVVFDEREIPASVSAYAILGRTGSAFVSIRPERALDVRWKDPFEVREADGRPLGQGIVLYPGAPEPAGVKISRKKTLLERLSLGERDMLLALADEKGLQGLRAEDIEAFCRLDRSRLETLARELEEQGGVRILSFSPLFLVSQKSLDFLRPRIASYLARYHKKHPGQRGAPIDRIENRFNAPRTVVLLAVRSLVKTGGVAMEKDTVWLADFQIPLSADDEEVLAKLEDMLLKGEWGKVSIDDIKETFHLNPGKLQTLLTVLTERKKIVEGRDGFILHSRWIEEIVKKIRESGKKELTVADFKAITGLTRKYAIPLLELLDEMGVTRRKGAVRDIL